MVMLLPFSVRFQVNSETTIATRYALDTPHLNFQTGPRFIYIQCNQSYFFVHLGISESSLTETNLKLPADCFQNLVYSETLGIVISRRHHLSLR